MRRNIRRPPRLLLSIYQGPRSIVFQGDRARFSIRPPTTFIENTRLQGRRVCLRRWYWARFTALRLLTCYTPAGGYFRIESVLCNSWGVPKSDGYLMVARKNYYSPLVPRHETE